MDDNQWENIKRSGGYRRKVLKAYRRILELDISQNKSTHQLLQEKKDNCGEESTRSKDIPNIFVGEDEGSVHNDFISSDFVAYTDIEAERCNSDDQDNEKNTKTPECANVCIFQNKIRAWALQHNISHSALRSLALILNDRITNIIPLDPRSLMKTPRTIMTTSVDPGEYWHNGVIGPVTKILQKCTERHDQISLCFNIDGLPVCKSSNQQFWPILGSIYEKPEVKPFIVGIYAGPGKPKDMNAFLLPFVNEMKEMIEMGIQIREMKVSVMLRCFVCDSPARAMIKGVCNFNGKHGCLKCTTVGEYSHVSHTVIFPDIDCPARNNEDFRKKMYGGHHKMDSILLSLPIDMIETFPVADALHLIDLGVMKRLLIGWRDGNFGKKDTKWRANDIQVVNTFLKSCQTPSEIHRSVRSLDHLKHWKGSEFRTFFLYLSVAILQEVLSHDAMHHFLTLFCAITICSNEQHFKFLTLARELLKYFVNNFKVFYGIDYVTSNIHNLTHVVDEVQHYGKLQSFDAYQYENKLYQIKNMLRQGNNLLSQAGKRLGECDDDNIDLGDITKCSNDDYPYVKKNKKSHKYVLHLKNFVLSDKAADKYFLSNDQDIMEVNSIYVQGKNIFIDCIKIINKENVFKLPINSSFLNIYKCKVSEHSRLASLCVPEDIKCKLFVIEYKSELYMSPLLHTL